MENIVDCIHKKGDHFNPYERIEAVGGVNISGQRFYVTSEEAISAIKQNRYNLYVKVNNRLVKVIVATRDWRDYLKTEEDSYEPNNLLSLPECQ